MMELNCSVCGNKKYWVYGDDDHNLHFVCVECGHISTKHLPPKKVK